MLKNYISKKYVNEEYESIYAVNHNSNNVLLQLECNFDCIRVSLNKEETKHLISLLEKNLILIQD